jgi:hypothetical protein
MRPAGLYSHRIALFYWFRVTVVLYLRRQSDFLALSTLRVLFKIDINKQRPDVFQKLLVLHLVLFKLSLPVRKLVFRCLDQMFLESNLVHQLL